MKSKNILINIIAPIIIALVGVILLFTVGFNYSNDVRGYSIAEINLTDKYEYDDAKLKIETVLEGEEVEVIGFNSAENQYGDTIVLKFRSDKLETQTFKDKLFTEFGYNANNAFEAKYISVGEDLEGQNVLDMFSFTLLGCLIALVGVAIYVGARFGLSAVMTLVLETISDLLLMLSLVLISRIEVGMYFGIAIVFTFVFAITNWAMMLNKFKTNLNDDNFSTKQNYEIVEISMQETRKTTMILAIVSAVVLALIGLCLSVEATHVCLACIAGILPVLYISQALSPSLWSLTAKRKTKVKKDKKEQV